MSRFSEITATNPPRLVVKFERGPSGEEVFNWGVAGDIPILSLLGHISQVQVELASGAWMPDCSGDPHSLDGQDQPPVLVIVWDGKDRSLEHFVNPDIPRDPLSGMLELIKSVLVASRLLTSQPTSRRSLLGPDGTPMRY
jgi:hypothetical protein